MDRPHVLILAPRDAITDAPADQAVHVDERVPLEDDPADRLGDRRELASGDVHGVQPDARHPAGSGITLDPSLAEEWPALRFALVPACARLELAWPVHRLWADAGAPMDPARTALRVWREGFAVYHTAMDAMEEAALTRLATGEPFAAVCEPFDDPGDAGAMLLRWVEDGIIAGR